MHYKQTGIRLIAEEGYQFVNKNDGYTAVIIPASVAEFYDCLPIPEPEETEVPDDGESANPV